ncbi:hypothetical protein ABIC90_000180 [Variovorax boronicumulans]
MNRFSSWGLFAFRSRVIRPAADLLSFASPKESKQRKGDPTVCDPSLRCGQPAVLTFRGVSPNSLRSNNGEPLSAKRSAPRRSQRGGGRNGPSLRSALDAMRAVALLGLGFYSLSPWGEGGGEGVGLRAGKAVFLRRRPSPQPSPQGEREQVPPAERSEGPTETRGRAKQWPGRCPLPSGCAEERSGSRTRARSCLSRRRVLRDPANREHRRLPRSAAKGSQTVGSPFFCLRFFGEAKKSRSAAGPRPGLRPEQGAQR